MILDAFLHLPFADKSFYQKRITQQHESGLKELFIGAYPGNNQDQRQANTDSFGIRGSTSDVIGVKVGSISLHLVAKREIGQTANLFDFYQSNSGL